MGYVYSEKFRLKILRQMVGPNAKSAVQLAKETGVYHSTISRWLKAAEEVALMAKQTGEDESAVAQAIATDKRPEDWTAKEKLHAVMEAEGLSQNELGAFLRERGLHEIHLEDWRATILGSLECHTRTVRKGEAKQIRELKKELRRKEKALAEAAALLVLKKKVDALWGSEDEEDDTEPKSGR